MVLRIDTYRGSYRASFYCPFWVVNATDLKFQFKVLKRKRKEFLSIVKDLEFRLRTKRLLLMLSIHRILFVRKNSIVTHTRKRFVFDNWSSLSLSWQKSMFILGSYTFIQYWRRWNRFTMVRSIFSGCNQKHRNDIV